MYLSSWFRRSLSKGTRETKNINQSEQSNQSLLQQQQEELLGVTEQLIDHVKTFTLDTFLNFPLLEDDGYSCDLETPTTSAKVRKDLSEWQEQHAVLVLSKVQELSQLRFKLCPRRLKEQQFWRIYFMLVKSLVLEYELRAVRLAKLKSMAAENEKSSDTTVCAIEMAEKQTKQQQV